VSKLTEIVDAATGDTVSISSLLRMVKVLAARMDTPPLIDWVDNELSGYPADAPLPGYRGPFPAEVVSEWSGPFQSTQRNVPLPSIAVPQGLRDSGAFETAFRQSVSELERIAKFDKQLGSPWPADTVAQLNGEIKNGNATQIVPMHYLVSAYQQISPALVESVLDNVRTRVLGLALDVEKVAPQAGEPGFANVDPAGINSLVVLNIYGHGNAVALDSPGAVQRAGVVAGDLGSLLKAVEALGLAAEDVADLEQAVRGDETDPETPEGRPGSRVRQFLGKVSLGGVKGAGQAAAGAVGNVVSALILTYYNVGN
jgi:hypothetical protein